MNIELLQPKPNDIPALRRLMQLYLYDLGSLDGWDIGDDGTYGNAERIEGFWTDERRQRYLVKVEGKLGRVYLGARWDILQRRRGPRDHRVLYPPEVPAFRCRAECG